MSESSTNSSILYAPVLSARQVNRLLQERSQRTKQLLTCFNTRLGRLLRLNVLTHVSYLVRRARCNLCSINNSHNVSNIEAKSFCNKCSIYLCFNSNLWRQTCRDVWHSDGILYQRINSRPCPRRKWNENQKVEKEMFLYCLLQ